MKQETTKEVTKKQTAALAIPEDMQGAWGAEESTSEDIIIPKILLMHGQSELVLKGDRQQGELIRSTDHEVLAKKNESIRVIPFYMTKTWRISELVGKQYEWRGEEAWTPENTDAEWEYTQDGKQMRRDKCYNFYCVLQKDTANGFAMPLRLQFTRTSRKAGNLIADFFAQCKATKTPPATIAWDISSEFINGDKNKYFIFTAKQSAKTTVEEMTVCKQWWDIVTKQKARIKDHDVSDGEATAATTENEERF